MSQDFESSIQQAKNVLLETVGSAEHPEGALLSAVARLFPSAVLNVKDGDKQLLRQLSADERQLLDYSARAALSDMVAASVEAGTPAMQWRQESAAQPSIPRLLDMFLQTSEHKSLDPGLPFGLLEDLVETVTISECEGVFTYLEANAAALERPRAKANGKHHMLRTCNQLLRRLSKGRNAVLCGRILLFLARLLPLEDRSGVNLQGTYNTGNVTPIEEVEEGALDSNGEPIDVAFYKRFWGLQSVFQHPGVNMAPAPWARAAADIQAVLMEFQKQKSVSPASSAPDSNGAELPAPKYLSSPKLMRLQLQDAAFRRHFLIQALVFLHCCQHPGRGEKETLKSKQLAECTELEAAMYKQLEQTPEKGPEFATAVRSVLADETHWSRWKKDAKGPKNETCAPFVQPPYKPPTAPPAPMATGPARKRVRADANSTARIRVGSPALDRLWNQAPNNMAGLKVTERKHLPSVREFLDPVIEDMDPENCIDDEYRRKHDKVYQWKALRMVSRESLPVFSKAAFADDLEVAARGLFPKEVPPEASAAAPETAAQPTPDAAKATAATAAANSTPSHTAAAAAIDASGLTPSANGAAPMDMDAGAGEETAAPAVPGANTPVAVSAGQEQSAAAGPAIASTSEPVGPATEDTAEAANNPGSAAPDAAPDTAAAVELAGARQQEAADAAAAADPVPNGDAADGNSIAAVEAEPPLKRKKVAP